MKFSKLSCSHPLFKWSSAGAWHGAPKGLVKPVVFVFERRRWLTPTPEKRAEYRLAARIVEQLGGSMNQTEYEIAGKAEPLSAKDVASILRAIRRDHPKAKVISHWNGVGSYMMSVGVDFRPTSSPEGQG